MSTSTLTKKDYEFLEAYYKKRIERFTLLIEGYEEALEDVEKQLDYHDKEVADDIE
jgi:hypothetical protein